MASDYGVVEISKEAVLLEIFAMHFVSYLWIGKSAKHLVWQELKNCHNFNERFNIPADLLTKLQSILLGVLINRASKNLSNPWYVWILVTHARVCVIVIGLFHTQESTCTFLYGMLLSAMFWRQSSMYFMKLTVDLSMSLIF